MIDEDTEAIVIRTAAALAEVLELALDRRARRRPTRSTVARGYGGAHKRERAKWVARVAAGREWCRRCGNVIQPWQAWDLDHRDDRTGYLGPSHARCNRRAGALKKQRLTRQVRKMLRRTSRPW